MLIDMIVLQQQEKELRILQEKIKKDFQDMNQEIKNINQNVLTETIHQSSLQIQERIEEMERSLTQSLQILIMNLKEQTNQYTEIQQATYEEIWKLMSMLDSIKEEC